MFYCGNRLLSTLDSNKKKPEILLSVTNRSAGKTTFFNSYLVKNFKKSKSKFLLLYRFSYELDNVADKFFKDIKNIFFPNENMTERKIGGGVLTELLLNEEPCGYACAINNADMIKKLSHLLSDVDTMLFDEFQSETNHYCPKEVQKFISIHQSVARGCGNHTRFVRVIMLSNAVTILNPYFVSLGISKRLKKDTKYLKGDGFVLEHIQVDSASEAQNSSMFNRAFAGEQYTLYASQNVYLNDNTSFVAEINGKNNYICTIKYENTLYCIREYLDKGIIYCSTNADSSYPIRLALTTDDHDINYVMLTRQVQLIKQFRYLFEHGCFRFKDLNCKNVILTLLSY